MLSWKVFTVVLTLSMIAAGPALAAPGSAIDGFSGSRDFGCAQHLAAKAYISAAREADARRQLEVRAEKEIAKSGIPAAIGKGLVLLIGLAAGDYALASYLAEHLPTQYHQFSDILVSFGSLAILKAYTSPWWEPFWARIRQGNFRMRSGSAIARTQDALQEQWYRTQESYSSTAHVSRGVINSFISRPNFHEAYNKFKQGDREYAAAQLAVAATLMRTLFMEILPDDIIIANHVHAAFTDHVWKDLDAEFVKEVREKIDEYDKNAREPEDAAFYKTLLKKWLMVPSSLVF